MSDKKVTLIVEGKDKSKKAFDSANKNLKNTSSLAKSMSSRLTSVGGSLVDVGKKMTMFGTTAVAAIGGLAVKSLVDFEKAMSNVNTLFDDEGQSVEKLSEGINEMLKNTPKSADDLGASAYSIVSAGINEADEALSVLDASQRLAVAGLGETSEATDILTSALNAFNLESRDADVVANRFFLAVKSGKTTVSELAQGFGQVAPLANELGIQFEDLIASASSMTTSGMKASMAYTGIKGALSNLLKPTKEMEEVMGGLGWTTEDLVSQFAEGQGLVPTLRKLANEVDNDQQKLAKMFGSVEGLNAVMMLLNETGDNAIDIQKSMVQNGDALNTAFQKQSETIAFQYEVLKNQLGVAMREMATVIMPYLVSGIQKLTDFIGGLSEKQLKFIAIAGLLVGALGPIIMVVGGVVSAVGTLIGVIGGPAVAVIGGIIAVLGVLASVIGLNKDKFDLANFTFKNFFGFIEEKTGLITILKNSWQNVSDVFTYNLMPALLKLWEALKPLKPFVVTFAKIVGVILYGALIAVIKLIEIGLIVAIDMATKSIETMTTVIDFITDKWDGFTSMIAKVINWIDRLIEKIKQLNVVQGAKNLVGGMLGFGGGRASGGSVSRGTSYLVGEQGPELFTPSQSGSIIPNHRLAGAGGNSITINISGNTLLDRRAGEKIGDQIIRKLKSVNNRVA